MGNMPFESKLPEDSVTVKNIGSWGFYRSPTDHCIYVKTDDYHPDTLRVTKKDLLELIAIMDRSVEETGREIIVELEVACSMEEQLREIVEKDKRREIFKGAKLRLELPK